MNRLKNSTDTSQIPNSTAILKIRGNTQEEMEPLGSGEANEIARLHGEITSRAHDIITDSIQIGKLLTQAKDRLHHGEWLPWVRKSLPFSERTARVYMRIFRERDRIKSAAAADLRSALRLINSDRTVAHEAQSADKAEPEKHPAHGVGTSTGSELPADTEPAQALTFSDTQAIKEIENKARLFVRCFPNSRRQLATKLRALADELMAPKAKNPVQ